MSILSEEHQKKIKELLISQKHLTPKDLTEAEKGAASKKTPFLSYLVQENLLTSEELTKLTADVLGLPYVNLMASKIVPSVLNLLPVEVAERFMAVPLGEMQNRLAVAMIDPNNVQAVDFLANKIGKALKVYMASEAGIRHVLEGYNTDLQKGVSEAITSVDSELEGDESLKEIMNSSGTKKSEKENVATIVQDSPISRALSTILEYAVRSRASDIHIEPLEQNLRIRCRVDGVLREIMKLPKSIEPALISRVKILSSLKIDEHRIPQDGQFTVRIGQHDADLRIAISPVVWGEQVIIRILDKTNTSFKLEELGYMGRSLRAIRKGMKRPNGMIITSGPTGSGKSTSLYALVQEIKNDSINIVTLEDPVEYKMEGVNQIQVNANVGLTFATGLRSILRQDPDVVLVGEIRDKETASLAIQAALTGHLVLSTLHTNSAAGVLPRLLDMGIEPFLIASTVNTIIGQRLVRKISDDKAPYQTNSAESETVKSVVSKYLPKQQADLAKITEDIGYKNLPLATQSTYTLYRGKETSQTPGGYKGRIGLYEVIDVADEIELMILNRSTSGEIQNKASELGMITMREDGYLKALTGLTTIDEVNRVTASESA
ncbi:Flp pilus assembly complex ATPase component TadA [Candidatus Saccharibacteria bacterium]|nr:Flp pilus assembly complex ATPase component TadA [Candidatus Saccharibacteria bacterium]MCA9313099.1 Flp pilus assembly complex ATPase component TadA [Candidatus Saccharibacteria bacterium]